MAIKTKFNNFFYFEVKRIVENRHRRTYKLTHLFNIWLNFAFILRFAITLAIEYGWIEFAGTESYDVFARIFKLNRSGNKDFSFIATFIGLSISTALLEAKLYFSRIDTVTWQMFYDLAVRNLDIAETCRKSPENEKRIFAQNLARLKATKPALAHRYFDWYARAKVRVTMWWNSERIYRKKFARKKLTNYPDMSLKLRLRLIVALDIANKISTTLIVSLYSSFNIYIVFYFLQLAPKYPVWYWAILAIELTYFAYMLIRVLEILIFQTNLAVSSAILFIGYVREANQFLFDSMQRELMKRQRSSQQKSKNIGKKSLDIPMGDVLRRFMAAHQLISHQIIYANREMWRTVLLVSMCNHIPNNAYMLFRVIGGTDSLLTFAIVGVQIVYILLTLLFLAAYSKVLHAAARYLPTVQMLISGERRAADKWKCVIMHELLHSGTKIGIAIGPSSTITYRLVFEIVLFYVGFLIYLFKNLIY